MAALVRHPLIDEILDARREYARGDTAAFEGYRNHAHRVYNFARSISSLSPEDEDNVAIAAAFHDLYAFDGLDRQERSIEEAARYPRDTGRRSTTAGRGESLGALMRCSVRLDARANKTPERTRALRENAAVSLMAFPRERPHGRRLA